MSSLSLPPITAGASDHLPGLISSSGKLELLDRMVRALLGGGHRVLIYSQFTRTLDILEDWLRGRHWGYCRIDGSVAGEGGGKRRDEGGSGWRCRCLLIFSLPLNTGNK